MKFCPNCGSPIEEAVKYCPECGADLTDAREQDPSAAPQTAAAATTPQEIPVAKKKISGLSITAFVLSLTFIFAIGGVILSIIDLAKNKNKKHGLSIAALVIGALFSLLLVIGQTSSGGDAGKDAAGTAKDAPSPVASAAVSTPSSSSAPSEAEQKAAYIRSCIEVIYKDVARAPDSFKGTNIRIEGKVIQVMESFGTTTLRVAAASNGFDDVWYVTYKRPDNEKRILEDDHIVIYGECTGIESYTTVLGAQVIIPALKAKYVEIAELSVPEYAVNILRFDIQKEKYGSSYEYTAIVEVKNTGASNLYLKNASFDIENSAGQLLQTDDFLVYSCPDILLPGEVGYLYTSYAANLDGITDTEGLVLVPQFDAEATYVVPVEYEVAETTLWDGKYGVTVTGRVFNQISDDNSYLYLTVVYFDRDGQVLGITGTSVTDLKAGKTASFEISGLSMADDFSADDVADYLVIARDSYYGF